MTRYIWPFVLVVVFLCPQVRADDLEKIRSRGVLRHLGIPYANFVTGSGDGLDVENIQRFAAFLGVTYKFIPTTWDDAIGDLTGRHMISGASVPVKGDILASGMTILDWRQKLVTFSIPVFPSQVWLMARADSLAVPIVPGESLDEDIRQIRSLIRGKEVLGMAHTCLEPRLYGLERTGARLKYFKGRLNEIAPALINNDAQLALLDVPDALVALEKWPGQIKIIGPVSGRQLMAAAFKPSSQNLILAFNRFFKSQWDQGIYQSLVEKYYPFFPEYYPEFFIRRPDMTAGEQ